MNLNPFAWGLSFLAAFLNTGLTKEQANLLAEALVADRLPPPPIVDAHDLPDEPDLDGWPQEVIDEEIAGMERQLGRSFVKRFDHAARDL